MEFTDRELFFLNQALVLAAEFTAIAASITDDKLNAGILSSDHKYSKEMYDMNKSLLLLKNEFDALLEKMPESEIDS